MQVYPYCLATAVSATALERLLREGEIGGYRDQHPWFVADRMLRAAAAREQALVLLLASGRPLQLSHWAPVRAIEVYHFASSRETRVVLDSGGGAVSPLFAELETVTLAPPQHQLEREHEEGLRPRRVHLDAHWLRPYAICETPPFIFTSEESGS